MPSFRIPNFINVTEFDNEQRYHLFEGYCITPPEKVTRSGRYFQRVWMDSKGDLLQLLSVIGYGRWWEEWEPDRSFWGSLNGKWKRKTEKI